MARGVKSNFRASPYRLSEAHVISSCAYRRYLSNVNFDKQRPLLASIQCHSNTTISLAMLYPALTIQIHSNTTIPLNIQAPTLLARLLQYPNVNCFASSLGRNNFRSRSQHARLLTISDVLVTSIVGMGDAEQLHRQIFEVRGGLLRSSVARVLQHLLGEDEAESGVSLQSLRSKLSPFLDSTSQTMSITALPRGGAASVFDHVDTPRVRRVCSRAQKLVLAALHCWKSGVLAMFLKSQLEQ